MKKLYIFTLFSLMILVNQTKAQWTKLSAPGMDKDFWTGYIWMKVSSDGKNLVSYASRVNLKNYATTYHYITSHDYGANWQVFDCKDMPDDMFWDGDVLYVRETNTRPVLRKSTDFGATFTVQNSTMSVLFSRVTHISNNLWFYVIHNGIYKSVNQGASWELVTSAIDNLSYDFIVANNSNLVISGYQKMMVSTDNGNSWKETGNVGLIVPSYNSLSKMSNGTLLFHTNSNNFAESKDNGMSWTPITTTLPLTIKNFVATGTDILALDADGSIYLSSDNGQSFSKSDVDKSTLIIASDMAVSQKDVFVCGSYGIYKYKNPATGIQQNPIESNLKVFPNPVKEQISFISNRQFYSYSIANMAGQIIQQDQITTNQIGVSKLNPGIYFLTVKERNGNTETTRIIKE